MNSDYQTIIIRSANRIVGELIGGYNQLVEHFADQKKVNYKGEIISE